ncbi:MAG TPA: hypothetical protein DE045_06080 [Oceanospirillaceae bacterium]|nr:hypothetical protein [Oceanospirillaceae bacterium]
MTIVIWIVGLALVAFALASGIGKSLGRPSAVEWCSGLGMSSTMMKLFGAVESTVAGMVLWHLTSASLVSQQLLTWACVVMLVIKAYELSLQFKTNQPGAAKVGPLVMMVLAAAVYYLLG